MISTSHQMLKTQCKSPQPLQQKTVVASETRNKRKRKRKTQDINDILQIEQKCSELLLPDFD